ncbi:MAG: phosphatase [Spirochaetota bacterium]
MDFEVDAHCHSIASGHSYSTIMEIARAASEKGLKMIGITDHGPAMPGGPPENYFPNLKVVPEELFGVEILRGVEGNIIDSRGNLDLPIKILETLDLILAGLHEVCLQPGTCKDNTLAMIKAIENPFIDIIVHPGNPVFPIDVEVILEAAKTNNTLIEINNSSLGVSRLGSEENCMRIADLCKKLGVPVAVGSDSHIATSVGEFGKVVEIFNRIDMPEDLVMNLSSKKFKDFLKSKGKKRFK